jgi:hypothetical protein
MTEDGQQRLDLDEVMKGTDLFKLAILGHAAIEELMDAAIAEAFGGQTPAELKRLGFRTRLALLAALTQLPKKYQKALMALAQVRHDFAHGRIVDLTPERGQALADAFVPLLDEGRHPDVRKALTDTSRPRILLIASLAAARPIVEVAANLARVKRANKNATPSSFRVI